MRRVPLTFAMLIAFAAAAPASAMEKMLTGAEIRDWINGNTIDGHWAGTHYRLFFRTDGISAYAADGAQLELGRWWVTETEFCALWQNGGEACYAIMRDGNTLIWQTMSVWRRNFTAEMLVGNQLMPQ